MGNLSSAWKKKTKNLLKINNVESFLKIRVTLNEVSLKNTFKLINCKLLPFETNFDLLYVFLIST